MLCCLVAVHAVQNEVEAQWHLSAPNRGCVEFRHTIGGSQFRTYACDGESGELGIE